MNIYKIRWWITLGILFAWSGADDLRAESPATFKVGEIVFTRPAAWEQVAATSPMRKAQLKVTAADGKASADVIFFEFAGGAGTVQANVKRWLGQFEEPKDKLNSKVETVTVGTAKVTYVQAEGTYKNGMPGGPITPTPDTALLGAIIELGGKDIFVRMNGPKALVKASAADLRKMIEGGLRQN